MTDIQSKAMGFLKQSMLEVSDEDKVAKPSSKRISGYIFVCLAVFMVLAFTGVICSTVIWKQFNIDDVVKAGAIIRDFLWFCAAMIALLFGAATVPQAIQAFQALKGQNITNQ